MAEPRTLTLTLQEGDAALVIRANSTSELVRHQHASEDEVPVGVQVLTAVALRIAQSEEFSHELLIYLHEQKRAGRGLPS